MSRRSAELGRRLDQLQSWAVGEALKCWRTVDPQAVMVSFAQVAPALTDLHRALCIEALTAVDLMMFAEAADAGFLYDPDWARDFPARPDVTYWGQDAPTAIRQAPVLVLWRVGQGDDIDAAMLRGWHALSRVYRTEAHQIGREVARERAVTDLQRRGL